MTSSSTKDADLVERLRAISYPNGSPQAEAADALEAAQARIAELEAKLVGVMDAWEHDQAKAKIALDQRDTAERERDETRNTRCDIRPRGNATKRGRVYTPLSARACTTLSDKGNLPHPNCWRHGPTWRSEWRLPQRLRSRQYLQTKGAGVQEFRTAMTEDIIKDLRARLATAERERDEALETLKMVREIGLADEDGAATVESVIERVLRTSPSASAVLGEKEKWPHKACKTPDECRRECVCLDAWNCSSAVLGGDQTGAPRLRHRGGTTYTLIGEGQAQTTSGMRDYDAVVVYRAEEDGRIWVRPTSEFYDGRFERVNPTRTEGE
jgi:hypothetical protein